MSFASKTALVTGAGGGMGLQISNELIKNGANVIMIDVKAEPADIANGPGGHLYLRADLSVDSEVAGDGAIRCWRRAVGGIAAVCVPH